MKMNYNVTGAQRKELVKAIEGFTGEKATYAGVPSCAYQIGELTITRNGILLGEASTELLQAIEAAGFVAEEPEEAQATEAEPTEEAQPEPINLTVELPMKNHTGNSLRNLVNLIYTRAGLLNKALGTSFRVDDELVKGLSDTASLLTVEAFLKAVGDFEAENGKAVDGLTFTPEGITFSSLPETDDADKLRTFTTLFAMMNKQAIDQKRIQAKEVSDENEKYALRIWLLRLGMNGSEFKTERKVLMANLNGHCAFRTPTEEAKWKARQAEKREELKAAKAAKAAAAESEEVAV